MINIWTGIALIMAFAISSLSGKHIIKLLDKLNINQPINKIGPTWHKNKKGTPTMGGIIFILSIVLTVVLIFVFSGGFKEEVFNNYSNTQINTVKLFSGLLMALSFGFIGFLDDYIKVKKNKNQGLTEMQKTIAQILIAIIYLASLYLGGYTSTALFIPIIGYVNIGFLYYPFAVFTIFATVNAVNITDGIDGLCTSITAVCGAAFLIAGTILDNQTMAVLAAALMGGCLGFFLFNRHPAQVFMGDTGSMFLGGLIVALAFGLNAPFLILFIGIAYVIDILTVLIQRLYYKATKKRIFKMTPIHHSFEISGYNENQIVLIFVVITIIGSFLGLFLTTKM